MSRLVMCRLRLIFVASPKEKRGSGLRALPPGARLCSCCWAPLLMIICLKGQNDMTCIRSTVPSRQPSMSLRRIFWVSLNQDNIYQSQSLITPQADDPRDGLFAAQLHHAAQLRRGYVRRRGPTADSTRDSSYQRTSGRCPCASRNGSLHERSMSCAAHNSLAALKEHSSQDQLWRCMLRLHSAASSSRVVWYRGTAPYLCPSSRLVAEES